VNEAPLTDGWFMKMKIANPRELEALMDEQAYKNYLATLG
jgi:glycine cleavage system H protein